MEIIAVVIMVLLFGGCVPKESKWDKELQGHLVTLYIDGEQTLTCGIIEGKADSCSWTDSKEDGGRTVKLSWMPLKDTNYILNPGDEAHIYENEDAIENMKIPATNYEGEGLRK